MFLFNLNRIVVAKMKKLFLALMVLAISQLAQPADVFATHGNHPQVDFNGDCAVSIGDILISLQERGLQYTQRFVVPHFGQYGEDICPTS